MGSTRGILIPDNKTSTLENNAMDFDTNIHENLEDRKISTLGNDVKETNTNAASLTSSINKLNETLKHVQENERRINLLGEYVESILISSKNFLMNFHATQFETPTQQKQKSKEPASREGVTTEYERDPNK